MFFLLRFVLFFALLLLISSPERERERLQVEVVRTGIKVWRMGAGDGNDRVTSGDTK